MYHLSIVYIYQNLMLAFHSIKQHILNYVPLKLDPDNFQIELSSSSLKLNALPVGVRIGPFGGFTGSFGQFYDLEVWGKAGEIAADRLTKGSRIAAFGQGVWREYQTKDGKTQRAYVVRVPSEGMTYLDTKAEAEALKGTGAAPAAGGDDIPF